MGTFGLELYDTADFKNWLSISGFVDEYDFWSSLSSISEGTTYDHMHDYLRSQGYTGTGHDMFKQFLEAQVGNLISMHDMATKFYEGAWSGGGASANNIVDEGGGTITDESGNTIDWQ